jgi:hypothetical protein
VRPNEKDFQQGPLDSASTTFAWQMLWLYHVVSIAGQM